MVIRSRIHDLAACLLSYPAQGSEKDLEAAAKAVGEGLPHCRQLLAPFVRACHEGPGGQLEEIFTATFDNNKERALEVGWQLHGDNYDRGAFMVRMRGLLREHGVPEGGELPDHLGLALRVLGRMGEEQAWRLAGTVLRPAVAKMQAGFRAEDNPYKGVMETVMELVESHLETSEMADG